MKRTADAMALDILLSDRSDAERRTALKALAASVDHNDARCPECGSRDITDNRAPTSSADYTLLCLDCGEQHCPDA